MHSMVILFAVFFLVCGLVPILYVALYFKVAQALKSLLPRSVRSMLSDLVGSIVASVLVLALAAPPGMAFIFVFAAPFYMVLLARGLYVLYRHPDRRQVTFAKMSIWLVTIAIVVSLHAYRANTDAKVAAELSGHIEAYREKNGAYPVTLDALGASSLAQAHHVTYFLDPTPHLWYRSTFSMFDRYFYDFANHQWVFRPD